MSTDLHTLFKEKKFNEILTLLNLSSSEEAMELSTWDFYYFVEAALATNLSILKLKLIKEYLKTIKVSSEEKSPSKVKNAIENQLFKVIRRQLSGEKISANLFQLVFEQILECIRMVKPKDSNTPYLFFLDLVVIEFCQRYLKEKPLILLDRPILNLIDELGHTYFSSETFTSVNPKNNQPIIHASRQEKFFVIKTALLFKLKEYNNVIDGVNQAFTTIKEFHETYDFSLKRNQAKAYRELNQTDQAIQIYLSLLSQKNEWYLHDELAEVFLKNNQLKEALICYIKAYLIYLPDMSVKVSLMHRMAKAISKDYPELGIALYHHEASLRKTKSWPISDELAKLTVPPAKYNTQELPNLLLTTLYTMTGSEKGTITKLLPNGKSGFVDQYFFHIKQFVGHPSKVKVGLKVEFVKMTGKDKHGNPSKEAIYIRESK